MSISSFENYEYDTKYKYYYTVFAYSNYLEAIVGTKKDFELVRVSGWVSVTEWQCFEPGSEKLKELIDAIHTPATYGYIICAPGGDQLGIMYFQRWNWRWWVSEVRLKNGNQIAITFRQFKHWSVRIQFDHCPTGATSNERSLGRRLVAIACM